MTAFVAFCAAFLLPFFQIELLLPGCTITSLACGISLAPRIVNGIRAGRGELPWVVNIHITSKDGINRCSGSLLTKRHILTAGHCLDEGSDRILVTYGGINLNESQKAYVKALTRHPDYEPVELLNDVAVFSLMEDLEFSRFVKPICLPDSSLSPRKLVNSYAVVAGYGALYDIDALQRKGLNASQADTRVLMRTSLRILDDRICYKRYYDKKTGSSHFHPGYQMCTYEKDTDTCVGDSGGALTVRLGGRFYQVGIVSGGRECASYYPGVYANVFNYIDWIVKAVEFLS